MLKLDTNRVRVLVKNASLGMILSTAQRTAHDALEIGRLGGPHALAELARAVVRGLPARRRVGRIAKHRRVEVERAWIGR